jgi:hypothetical protein
MLNNDYFSRLITRAIDLKIAFIKDMNEYRV